MRERSIAYAALTLIGLFLIGFSLFVTVNRTNKLVRIQEEQTTFDELCVFIMPDGALYIPAEELEGDNITFHFTRKP